MSYQVLARKWRPRRFDDVVGQRAVTQTLRNALASGRIGQAFVLAGPRGVGKTTTARIFARALNCESGPTPDPCGTCEACQEIAEGRDIDVLEIDAATHTGIDNVREVIIRSLPMAPVRDRYKVFIIDEVHRFSPQSFDALLKSLEEPPPHVVFMMATTELHKVPETILSRAQLYEFKTVPVPVIAAQLRTIADAEGIEVDDRALLRIARAAQGSMRDAQTAFEQVIAFAGPRVTAEDVSAVLGLIGRDWLIDAVTAVADEDAAAAFALAGRAVEAGYDLRRVCQELSALVRDLLVLSIDPSRAEDAEIAAEADRERLLALASRFSREDLLRAFDLLTEAETEIKSAADPRSHLEMALVRWIHLRKLVPLADVLQRLGAIDRPPGGEGHAPRAARPPLGADAARKNAGIAERLMSSRPAPGASVPGAAARPAMPAAREAPSAAREEPRSPVPVAAAAPAPAAAGVQPGPAAAGAELTNQLLADVRSGKDFLYRTVLAQAHRIEHEGDRITFTFESKQRVLRDQLEQNRPWLESIASRLAGRRISIQSVVAAAAPAPAPAEPPAGADAARDPKTALKARAMSETAVQALLDVFPGEIRDVEEI